MHTIENEGLDHINISLFSTTPLGKQLFPSHPLKKLNIETVIGEIGNIRNVMDFLVIEKYPINLLRKSKLTRKDITYIETLKKTHIPNYWACVAYFIGERIFQDDGLISLIEEYPELDFVSYNVKKSLRLGTGTVFVSENSTMGKYIDIINIFCSFIRTGNLEFVETKEGKELTDVAKKQFIEIIRSLKTDPKLNIFHGVPFHIDCDI